MRRTGGSKGGGVGVFVFACWFFAVVFFGYASLAVMRGQYSTNRDVTRYSDEPALFVVVVTFMYLVALGAGALAAYVTWRLFVPRQKGR